MKTYATILCSIILFGKSFLFSQTPVSYYVCDCQSGAEAGCIPGDDSNTGTNPSSPWRTYEHAQSQFASLNAGDRILFARGGSFEASSSRWVNLNGRRDNPITIGDYTPVWASQNPERPILTNLTDGIFRLEDGGNADHDEGYIIRNLMLRGGGNGWAIFLYNDADYVLMDSLVIDGFIIGVHCAGANAPNPGADQKNDHITLRNSRILNNSGQGWLGGGSDILIEKNRFENNGFAQAVFNHNIYVSNSQDVIIRNNDLYRSAMVNGICQGVSLVVHGVMSGLVIQGNIVHEDIDACGGGCWGIAVDPGYASAESFRGTVIEGNIVVNVGNIAIGTASCPDCIIENNVIVQEQSAYGTIGIAVPDRSRAADDAPDSNVTVRNNSIYMNNPANGSIGIEVGTEGSSHLVVGNIIEYMGNSSSWSCFRTSGLTPSSFEDFNNNLCFFPNSPGGRWEYSAGSLDNWRSATGFDNGSFIENPLFISPASPVNNLALSDGSPAVNSSHPSLSALHDITGRLRDAAPDMGAYEYIQNDLQAPTVPRNLTATPVSSSRIDLSWSPSADNIFVAGYYIYRDADRIDTSISNYYNDSGLLPATGYTYAVQAFDPAGNVSALSSSTFASTPGMPFAFSLFQNYPNPFNPITTIGYTLHSSGHVELAIYDVLGRKIRILADEIMSAGMHETIWDGRDASGRKVASGIYFYSIETSGGKSAVKKMIFLN
jgi:hypothetical protein